MSAVIRLFWYLNYRMRAKYFICRVLAGVCFAKNCEKSWGIIVISLLV